MSATGHLPGSSMTGSVSPALTDLSRPEVAGRSIDRRTTWTAIADVPRAVAMAGTVVHSDVVAVGGGGVEHEPFAPAWPWPTWRRRLGLPGAGATPAQSYFSISI